MSEIIVINEHEAVIVSTDTAETVVTGLMGPPGQDGIMNLSQAHDVDLTGLSDGATLVYTASESKWKATTKLESQILEAGQF